MGVDRMEQYPNMIPQRRWKTTRVLAITLFLLAYPLFSHAGSSKPATGAARYPAITIYVGSG